MGEFDLVANTGTFSLDDPDSLPISTSFIASRLSAINRFSGRTYVPWSVAEHSLLVADIIESLVQGNKVLVINGLLHDGMEAVYGDILAPYKRYLRHCGGEKIFDAEDRYQKRILTERKIPQMDISLFDELAMFAEGSALVSARFLDNLGARSEQISNELKKVPYALKVKPTPGCVRDVVRRASSIIGKIQKSRSDFMGITKAFIHRHDDLLSKTRFEV
jgi:hypothetical protein